MWLFFYLYFLYQDYKKSRRVKPDDTISVKDTSSTVKSDATQKPITYSLEYDEYYRLLQNLRDFQVLTKNETGFIQTLEKDKLLEIITIYNENMKTMNDILYYL
jgi:hypothetical protein